MSTPHGIQDFDRFVAVDWGTSSLRGALLNRHGQVLEERSTSQGILSVPADGFATVFEANFGDWMLACGTFGLISGMAGSRQGWSEAPYRSCPAGFAELGQALHWLPGLPWQVAIVPGLSQRLNGVPDVMRGEEVQIFGAMQLAGCQNGLFVLPGTHSKWATVVHGQVTGFQTYMTGEFYALLSQHSILARTLDAQAPFDAEAFCNGVGRAQSGPGLLHHAFGTRALSLFGELGPEASASYLSGLLIGDELRAQALAPGTNVQLIGSATLTGRYALALESLGHSSRTFDSQATWSGLHALALDLIAA